MWLDWWEKYSGPITAGKVKGLRAEHFYVVLAGFIQRNTVKNGHRGRVFKCSVGGGGGDYSEQYNFSKKFFGPFVSPLSNLLHSEYELWSQADSH